MSIIVFWLASDGQPRAKSCDEADMLGQALGVVQALREDGFKHVTISSDFANSVGKPGVDVTGPDYDWKKRRQ